MSDYPYDEVFRGLEERWFNEADSADAELSELSSERLRSSVGERSEPGDILGSVSREGFIDFLIKWQRRAETRAGWVNSNQRALIVVDVQNDFVEGGALAVVGGRSVAARINDMNLDSYGFVLFSRDWHIRPGDHFAAEGSEPDYVASWPVHCVANSGGAAFASEIVPLVNNLDLDEDGRIVTRVIHKGELSAAYSAFEGKDVSSGEHLVSFLNGWGVQEVDVVGLAFDYCVKATAIDSAKFGFDTRVIKNLTASVHPDNDPANSAELTAAGVQVIV